MITEDKMDKRIPVRTCIGCNNEFPKKDLFRFVRKTDEAGMTDSIIIDTSGALHGRGCYLCRNMDCLEKALKKRSFERTFKDPVPERIKEDIREEFKRLTQE